MWFTFMLKFENSQRELYSKNVLVLSSEVLVAFENEEEEVTDFMEGTPLCWDKAVISLFDNGSTVAYNVCAKFVPYDSLTKTMEYKCAKAFRKAPKSVYYSSFEVANGRVFFGVFDGPEIKELSSCPSTLFLFGKKECSLDFSRVGVLLEELVGKEEETSICNALEKISVLFPNIVVLDYVFENSCAKLYILKKDIKTFVSEEAFNFEAINKDEPVYRKFFI